MKYRRSQAQGTTFFCGVTYNRKKILDYEANVSLIKEAFRHVIKCHTFQIRAFVVLPDHIHSNWTK
ncbi:MAG: transposase [Candidatus Kuenenia sp.]|nr:transposase [Candidatus Kuenenia hertensis]